MEQLLAVFKKITIRLNDSAKHPLFKVYRHRRYTIFDVFKSPPKCIHFIVMWLKKKNQYAPQLKYLCYIRINNNKRIFLFYQDVNFKFYFFFSYCLPSHIKQEMTELCSSQLRLQLNVTFSPCSLYIHSFLGEMKLQV